MRLPEGTEVKTKGEGLNGDQTGFFSPLYGAGRAASFAGLEANGLENKQKIVRSHKAEHERRLEVESQKDPAIKE